MKIEGQCHCGAVRYEAEIDPANVSICHCTDCQTLTGSPYRVSVLCPGDRLTMTGATKIYRKTGDSGRVRLQHFCADCGSPMFACGDGPEPGDWNIRWGSIRERSQLKPTRQIWCRSAVAWTGETQNLPARSGD